MCAAKKSPGDTGLTSNMEDYMEAIIVLSRANRVVRVKDIAKELGITMPSVTAALGKLRDMELITYEKYGHVELTERGVEIADDVFRRHSCVRDFFESVLGIPEDRAGREACLVEHDLSPDTCGRIQKMLDFIQAEDEVGNEWVERFRKTMKP